MMAYDPEKHHRRSIRLKGHDYAGGGLYFVTLCAHREAMAAAGGAPFGATPASPVRKLMEERVRITAENRILILEMRNRAGDLAAAEQWNRFVLEQADALWLPHVAPGGMLDRLVRALGVQGKIMASGDGVGRGESWKSGRQRSDPR